jgi:hypothetical protein
MVFKAIILSLFLSCISSVHGEELKSVISRSMAGLEVKISDNPYSRTIERMLIGYDSEGNAKVGIAHRKIESYKPITGIVIVHWTPDGFILHEALFPDIKKIRNAKDRKQVLSVLKQFKAIPFDPHAEKSAVDGLTGATRYGIKTSGYLNYMARRTALEMKAKPDWPIQKSP